MRSCTCGRSGEDVDEASQLGQPGHPTTLFGDVADVGDAAERNEVMLAQRPHLDVLHQDQLVVADIKHRRQHLGRVLVHPGEQFGVQSSRPCAESP